MTHMCCPLVHQAQQPCLCPYLSVCFSFCTSYSHWIRFPPSVYTLENVQRRLHLESLCAAGLNIDTLAYEGTENTD